MNVDQAVRALCLSLPEAQEKPSHGSPDFRVRGKTFASYMVNHHGDGRVALWLNVSRESQRFHCERQPRFFFVPPYVGPRGWLGVRLDRGLSWKRIGALVREAYEKVAPRVLVRAIGETPVVSGKVKPLSAVERDPLQGKRAQSVLARLRRLCLALPETSEARHFGSPAWRAGKKTFASLRAHDSGLSISLWVGAEGQAALTGDPRFRVPAYAGHHGWIALDVSRACDWDEIGELTLGSYRHYALRRMLARLDTD